MDDDTRFELDSLRLTDQTQVHRMWELLIRPLGWRTTTLYIGFVDADGRPLPYLAEVLDHDEPGGSVVFLIARRRPGRADPRRRRPRDPRPDTRRPGRVIGAR